MNELTFSQLDIDQRSQAEQLIPQDAEAAKFFLDEAGKIAAYRLPMMFVGATPTKWDEPLGLDGTPIAVAMAAPVVAPPGLGMDEWPGKIMKLRGEGVVKWISIDLIDRCPLNPRKKFERSELDDLKQSLRANGFVEEMSHLWLRPQPNDSGRFELIDGERRWIVIGELVKEGVFPAGLEVAATVSVITDRLVVEMALINAMQRKDYSPMEEAEAICMDLELSRMEGEEISNKELAARLGCDEHRIRRAKLLHCLHGTEAGRAIGDKKLSARHGELLASIGDVGKREELARRVLYPTDGVEKKVEILEQWIQDEVRRDLRTAPFDLVSPVLVTLQVENGERNCGGACASKIGVAKHATEWDCPFVESKHGVAFCMNPACFEAKTAAAGVAKLAEWRAKQTQAGYELMAAEAEAALWDDMGKRLRPESPWEEVETRPAEWMLKAAVKPTDIKSWKKLVQGKGVPVLAVLDRGGDAHYLVDREAAKTAAKDNGYDIFRGAKGAEPATEAEKNEDEGDPRIAAAARGVQRDAEAAKRQAEVERANKIEEREMVALDRGIVEGSRGLKKLTFDYWRLVLAPMAEAVRENGHLEAACLALGMSLDKAAFTPADDQARWLDEAMRETPEVHLPSVALILARHMLYHGEEPQWLKLATKTFSVDAKGIHKRAVAEVDAEIAAEAERKEIVEGVQWLGGGVPRGKADEFEWADDGYCVNPNLASLLMPKGVKHQALVATARTSKGWAYGYELRLGKKVFETGHANRNQGVYGDHALALKAGLLALQKAMEDHGAPEAARQRVAAYIANVELPADPPPKGKKRVHHKGTNGTKGKAVRK